MKEPKNRSNSMHVRDMTTGDPLRLILIFAAPLFIGNIFQQLYNLVDTVVVGHCIGDHAISAIGATSSLYILLISLASSLNNGYAIIIARAFGAHNKELVRKSIAGTILLNIGATVSITAFSVLFLPSLMRFLNTPESIFDDAYRYIIIICAGMFSTISYNMFAGILRAVGNSRTPLYCLIFASVINIGLDLLFVVGFDMGITGVAIATVLAQTFAAILSGLKFFLNYSLYTPQRADYHVPKKTLSELLSTGTAMALMLGVVRLGTLIFQGANNALGETYITAYAAGRKLISLVMQPLNTIAEANSTFVSQNWGAKQYGRIQSTLKKVMAIEIAWGIIACILMFSFGDMLVGAMTGTQNTQIIADAVLCMRASGPFFPILGVLLCLRTAMQAMGSKKAPVISSCVELALKAVGAAWVIPRLGFIGSCFTEPSTWVFMTIYLVLAYLLQRKKIYGQEAL